MLNLLTLYGMYCFFIYVATCRQLRPDVLPAASRRIARCVGTYHPLRRHAVLGASAAGR